MSTNTKVSWGWKNGIIWLVVTLLAAAGSRLLMWKFMCYDNMEIDWNQLDLTLVLLMVSVVLPLVMYLVMYTIYIGAGNANPSNPSKVARGKSWVLPLILQLVLGLVLIGLLWFVMLITGNGGVAAMALLICSLVGYVVDAILLIVGKIGFKPDRIQKS